MGPIRIALGYLPQTAVGRYRACVEESLALLLYHDR
jgi:hypothetical protein